MWSKIALYFFNFEKSDLINIINGIKQDDTTLMAELKERDAKEPLDESERRE